ncbi:MAG: hypothetical protein ACPGUD_06815 [Parashewanella sp.]
MINETNAIDSLKELERFLLLVEKGGLGLSDVAGVGLATNNSDGKHFIAVFNEQQQLIYARNVTKDVFENGKEMVKHGVTRTH